MPNRFHLEYEVENAGWATARIRHGDVSVVMTASHLHDSLRELATAAHSMARGSSESRVIFMDEPGEHHLIFSRKGEDECQYSITWYDDRESWGIRTVPGSRHVCDGIVPIRRLVQQVYTTLWTIHQTYGEAGYKARWFEHDFPLQEMKRLVEIQTD